MSNDQKSTTMKRRDVMLGVAATLPLAWALGEATFSPASAQTTSSVVLITGSSSGFGQLIATTMARAGYHVIASMREVSGRNAAKAKLLTDLASAEKLKIDVVEIDVTSDASVSSGVTRALELGGKIDVLVNNAGIAIPGPVEMSLSAVQSQFDTNLFGQLRLLRAVAPGMRAARSGLIIQMSSAVGRFVIPTTGAYSATKFAQEALFESAAYELHSFGVEMAIVQPGEYRTSFKENGRRYLEQTLQNLNEADRKRVADYAEVMAFTQRTMEDGETPPAQEVADAVLKLVQLPVGSRQLRTAVVPPEFATGLNQLNGTLEETQKGLLQSIGMGSWLTLSK
jgi:NAD(P)-dependent dehydrogenase (short-subunit alcohol dehydrogenase family)